MIRKILMALVLVPLAIVAVMFAVANRQAATVSFDPFDTAQPAYAVTLPLFILIFGTLILGVLVGGIAAWLRQAKWRRIARRLDDDVVELKREVNTMRQHPVSPQRTELAQLPVVPPPL
jgi:uncharacterized integral membrane protein